MLNGKKQIYFFFIVLLFGFKVQGQTIDLDISNGSVSPSSIPDFNSPYSLNFTVNNKSTSPGVASIINVSITDQNFNIANFSSISASSGSWSCIFSGTLDCTGSYSAVPFSQGDSVNVTVNLLSPSIATNPGLFNLDLSSNLSELTLGDNSIQIASQAPPQADLAIDSSFTPSIFSLAQGDSATKVISFRVVNNGSADSVGEHIFSLSYDGSTVENLVFQSEGWTCTTVPAKGTLVDCSSGPGYVLAAGTSVVFDVAYNVVNAKPAGNYMFTFGPAVSNFTNSESSMTQFDNSYNVDLNIVANPADLSFITSATQPVYDILENDTSIKTVTYRVTNTGGDLPGGNISYFSFYYDSSAFTANFQNSTGWTCPSSGAKSTNKGSLTFMECDSFSFTNGEVKEVIIEFSKNVSAFPSTYTLGAEIGDFNLLEVNTINNDLDVTVNVNALTPEYQMTANGMSIETIDITDNAAPATFPFTFELINTGTGAAFTGESVSIDLNSSAFVLSNPTVSGPGSWSCSPKMDPTQGFDCFNSDTGNGIPVGTPVTFTGDITGYPTALGTTNSAFSATVSASDSNPTDNTASYSVSIIPGGTDLVVTKFVKDGAPTGNLISTAMLGDTFFYHIHVDNPSNLDATGVAIVDNVPAGIEVLSDQSTGGWGCTFDVFVNNTTSQQVTCNYTGSIPNNSPSFSESIILEVRGVALGVFDNVTDSVNSLELDLNPSNNTNGPGTALISIQNPDPDVIVTKSITSGVTAGEAIEGTQVIFKILAKNNTVGSALANDVVITDTLPAGVTYSSHNILGPNFDSCDISALPTITCSSLINGIPNSAAEDGVEIIVDVTGTVGTSITNTADVTALNDINSSNNSASSTAFVVTAAPLPVVNMSIQKTAQAVGSTISQTDFVTDEVFEYNLVIQNTGVDDAQIGDIELTDNVPTSLIVENIPTSPDWDCTGSVGNNISCVNAAVIPAATGTSELVIAVSSSSAANGIINSASVGLTTAATVTETDTSNNTDTFSINIIDQEVDLDIVKSAQAVGAATSQTDYLVGEAFEYSLAVHNTGGFDAPIGEVELTDIVPTELTVSSVPTSPDWNCSASTGNNISCTNTVVIPATSGFLELIIPVTGNTSANSVVNNASVALSTVATVTETNIANNSDTFAVNLLVDSGQLTISKSSFSFNSLTKKQRKGVSEIYEVDENFIYNIFIQNNSTVTNVEDLVITDVLPNEVQFVSVNNDGNLNCSYDSVNNEVECLSSVIDPFVAGSNVSVDIEVTAASAGTGISNIANLSSLTTGDNLNSNEVLVDIIQPSTTLSATKSAIYNSQVVSSIPRGVSYKYEVDVQNTGTSDAINVQVTDIFSADLQVDGFSGANWDCTLSSQTYNCVYLATNLASGLTTSTLVFDVTNLATSTTAQVTNTVDVSADNSLQVSATSSVDVIDSDVVVTVTQDPDTVLEGEIFDILVEITNNGASGLADVVVKNTLPAGFTYNTTTVKGTNATCSVVGQDITCSLLLAVPAGSTETIVISANAIGTADTSAVYTNTTEVSATGLIPSSTVTSQLQVVVASVESFDLTLTDSVDPVEVGQQFIYTAFVNNTGTSTISDLNLTLDGDPNLNVLSVNSNLISCNLNTGIADCQLNSGVSIAPNTSLNVGNFIVVSPSFVGTTTTELIATTANNIGEKLTASTTETTTITEAQIDEIDMSIVKQASVSQLFVNTEFKYLLTVRNNSDTIDGTNVVVNDNLPNGIVLESIVSPGWVCSGTSNVSCSRSLFPSNSSSTIELNVKTTNVIGQITNRATLTSTGLDPDLSNNTSTATVEVVEEVVVIPEADIQVSKFASTEVVTSGGDLDWIIKVENNGPDAGVDINVEDNLPTGYTFSSLETNGNAVCEEQSSKVSCTISSLPTGVEETITVKGVASIAEGDLVNSVTVSSTRNDPDLTNNTTSQSVTVEAIVLPDEADLEVNILPGAEIRQGQLTEFEIQVTNSGPDTAVNPELNLNITGLIETLSVNSPDWNCQPSENSFSCKISSIQNNKTASVKLTVKTEEIVIQAQDLVLTASIQSETNDPELANNNSNSQIAVEPTPEEDDIETVMLNALNGAGGPQVRSAVRTVSSYCENYFYEALEGFCSDLYQIAIDGDGATLEEFMRQITPNEVLGQSSSAAEIIASQFRNIDARLSQLRGGGGGFSMAGLNATYGSGSLPLEMLSYLKETASNEESNSDFISPWGFFINGTISMGDRDPTERELGFDFETTGLTAGIDYRLSSKKVIGLALGYANFESEVSDKSAKIESKGVTLTGYGSFYINDNFFVDARLSYGKPDFDQSRDINFTLGDVEVERTAVGSTDADQYTFALSTGYHFNKNAWNFTPNASIKYVRTKIGDFTETGAGDFNFYFSEQSVDSLVWSAGLSLSRAISLKKGVFTPQFDFSYNYESENDGNEIQARFINAPIDEVFIIEADSPDRAYGSAGIGFVYVTANGKQAYINYRSVLGLEGFSRGTINLGARFEF